MSKGLNFLFALFAWIVLFTTAYYTEKTVELLLGYILLSLLIMLYKKK